MRLFLVVLLVTACKDPQSRHMTRDAPAGPQCPELPASLTPGSTWTPEVTLNTSAEHYFGPTASVYPDGTVISVLEKLHPNSLTDWWPLVCANRVSMCRLSLLRAGLANGPPPRGDSTSIGMAIDRSGAKRVWSRPAKTDAPSLVVEAEATLASCSNTDPSDVLLVHRAQGALNVVLEDGRIEQRGSEGSRLAAVRQEQLATLTTAIAAVGACEEPSCVIGDRHADYVEYMRAGDMFIAYTASELDSEAVRRLRALSCRLADAAFPNGNSTCFPSY